MQQMWSRVAVIGMLTICSIEDIRKKQIQLNLVLGFGILGILFHMLWQSISLESLLLGMAVGAGIVLLSVCSGGKIGIGDGVLLIVTGIFLGLEQNLELLLYAIFICGIWAALLVLFQRKHAYKNGSCTIPFVPFLFFAYLLMLAY